MLLFDLFSLKKPKRLIKIEDGSEIHLSPLNIMNFDFTNVKHLKSLTISYFSSFPIKVSNIKIDRLFIDTCQFESLPKNEIFAKEIHISHCNFTSLENLPLGDYLFIDECNFRSFAGVDLHKYKRVKLEKLRSLLSLNGIPSYISLDKIDSDFFNTIYSRLELANRATISEFYDLLKQIDYCNSQYSIDDLRNIIINL